jgi:proteasome lid subunit RPN8/RPN11
MTKRMKIAGELLGRIQAHGEATYPEEGAGFLLGTRDGDLYRVMDIMPLPNVREEEARRTRYLISPEDTFRAEEEADRRGLSVIGVFHSHPDHPVQPSDFDHEWALPWFVYVITRVEQGRAVESRCWHLTDDHSGFEEESIVAVE